MSQRKPIVIAIDSDPNYRISASIKMAHKSAGSLTLVDPGMVGASLHHHVKGFEVAFILVQ